jgi:hypothetical protein
MEFYELNRLFDENLVNTTLSRTLDHYLYSFIPVIVSFGCGLSLVNIIALAQSQSQFTSKHYLYAQSIFAFLFQITTSLVLITNYYEKILLNYYFKNVKQTYLTAKLVLGCVYSIFFYCIIWLFTISALNFAFISVIQFNLNKNFNRIYSEAFTDYLAHFNRIKRNLNSRLKRQLSVNSNYAQSLKCGSYFQQSININNTNHENRLNSANSINSNLSRNIDDYNNLNDINQQQQQHSQFSKKNSINNNNINPLIMVNNHPDAEFNSYLDELNMFEFENNKKKKKIKSPSKEKHAFCSTYTIKWSIITTFLVAILVALPQFIAYEVKLNIVGVSTSKISTKYINIDNIKTYENIYFIREEIKEDTKTDSSSSSKQENYLIYSRNMAQAYGIALELETNQSNVLTKLKTTYSNFFTMPGIFDLASKRYDLCNSVRNSEFYSAIRRPFNLYALIASDSQLNQTWNENEIEILNVSLVCIAKGTIKDLLTYNTLYFWLEHTLALSMPICIILVVLISNMYTFLQAQKLGIKQSKTRNKIKKLHKIFIETSNLNKQTQMMQQQQIQQQRLQRKQSFLDVVVTPTQTTNDIIGRIQETDILEIIDETPVNPVPVSSIKRKLTRGQSTKSVHIKDDLNENDDLFETDDLNFIELGESLETQIETEQRIHDKQHEHMMLNVMFILDLILYIIFSFPYTTMRLVLDLFVKDQVKVNLDFYVAYKFSILMFNFHLILKFFIMVIFNINFRICLCKVFAFSPAFCCIDEKLFNEETKNKMFCCQGTTTNINNNIKQQRPINRKRNYNYEDDDLEYNSTEFNSNLHQYNCPADPISDQVFIK